MMLNLQFKKILAYLRQMKPVLLLLIMFLVLPLHGQSGNPHSMAATADTQSFTLVVKAMDTFEIWAAREQVQIIGAYPPAKIVVIRTTSLVFKEKIAQHPLVLFISTASGSPKPELPVPGQNLFVNKINVAQALFPQFDGLGSVVSIKEFRFDPLDVDLKNRVLDSPDAANELTTHAAIMSSLVGGAGNSDTQGRGAAPGCVLISSGFGLLLPEADYAAQGITVQNHAYGVGIENFYGANALAYDVSTQENPHLLHVFSAGNNGMETSSAGKYAGVPGFSNLTGNFKMAKNVLTVGAVDSLGALAFFSSRGPAYDGRTKPDLVAFGHDGSSGAAALVSGAAAVLQQAYYEQYGSLPGADLIRAVLINAAEDRGRPGPDFEYGFGNLNLEKSVPTIAGQRFLQNEIAAGQVLAIPISMPSNIQQFKITLTWNGVPAQAGAAKALVHDLDMAVLGPAGQGWQPWVLNTAPNVDSLKLPAARGRDTLNNIEQITIDEPAPGQYTVQVIGSSIAAGSQPFSIAYSFDTIGTFQWTYPLCNDPAVAGKGAVLAWETNIAQDSGQVAWKAVGDADWHLIGTPVSLKNGVLRWLIPDTFTEAQVRMSVGANDFVSDTFLISKELRLKLGFNCPDSVALYWSKAADGARYLLYGLGQYQMEPLFETSDTFVSLHKSLFPQQRFAVAPIGPSHAAIGKRSAAPDISQQGVRCYQKSFFAALTEENQVDISLELASLYGVTAVYLEKWDGAGFSSIKAFEMPENEHFAHTDPSPGQGRNLYRALISTSNSGAVPSDTAAVFFSGTKNWLVFPNPISSSGILKLLSNHNGEAEFWLFDALGRLIFARLLEDTLVEIPLPNLPEGFYFFETLELGKRQWGGRLGVVK